MNIKEYNHQLNDSYLKDDAFKRWHSYRKSICDYITSTTLKNQSVLLIGAGNCNDLDLSIFESSNLTILDIDLEAVQNGLNKQEFKGEYQLIEADLTGLQNTSFLDDYKQANERLKVLDQYRMHTYTGLEKSYDIIIILPIYTQLLLPQLLPLINDDNDLSDLLTFIAQKIQLLHLSVREHLKPSGLCFLFSDILEYPFESEESRYLQAHETHTILLSQHFENYLQTYGHSLGSYCFLEMSEYFKPINEHYFIWPFDEQRLLLVKGAYYKK